MSSRVRMVAVALAGALIGGAQLATVAGQDRQNGPCTVAAIQAVAPAGTTITGAAVLPAGNGLPPRCQVDGHAVSSGNDVNFQVALPDTWNGKFWFAGVGGLAGRIGALDGGLERGYASASTDTGHTADDPDWGANRAQEIDYGYRGTHVATVATKALTTAYYQQAPQYAYFEGCSNGGRQAMMEAQRYPDDFDGIIAGHPATGTPMQVGRAIVAQHLLASRENYLPPGKVELLSRATLAACDQTDGLVDGLVSEPGACRFDPQTLACTAGDGPECLTPGQVATVNMIYAGLTLPNGERYTPGFPVGHEGGETGWQAWITGRTPAAQLADGSLDFVDNRPAGFNFAAENMRFLALDADDPSYSWRTVRFPEDLPRLQTMSDILSPLDVDLTPFRERGGRLLMYHGWADPAISAYGSIDYYEQMTAAVGGREDAESFARLYLAPGMHHCRGGAGPDSFDMLTALEDWVERGIAPAAIVASREVDGVVERTRPLCPHPQVARYTGTGSIDDAASFRCEAP